LFTTFLPIFMELDEIQQGTNLLLGSVQELQACSVVGVQVLIQVEIFFITKFRNVKDLTRSVSNLTPEFVVHRGVSQEQT